MYIVLADPTHLLSHVFSPFGSSTCTNSPYIFHPSAAALAPILHTSSTLRQQHLHQFSIHLPPFWSSTCTNSPYIFHPFGAAPAPILHTSSTLLEQHLHQFSIHPPPMLLYRTTSYLHSFYSFLLSVIQIPLRRAPPTSCSTSTRCPCQLCPNLRTPSTLSCCLSYKFHHVASSSLLAGLPHVSLVSCA